MSNTMDIENDTDINAEIRGSSSVDSERGPHLLRVTDHHKIRNLVRFALDFLVTHAGRPLVLHTMPNSPGLIVTEREQEESKTRTAREKCTTSVARLISVVEIIKREFPKALMSHVSEAPAEVGGGATLSSDSFNLHQYNEVGCKEDLFPSTEEESQEERAERIRMLLEGKNHPKIKRTPYMKITLSREPVPALADGGIATYQAPVPFKFSKAQKARAKKRAAKLAAANGGGEGVVEDGGDQAPQPPASALRGIVGNTGSIVL